MMFTKITVELTVPHAHAAHVKRAFDELLDYLTLRRTLIFDSHVSARIVDSPQDPSWGAMLHEANGHSALAKHPSSIAEERAVAAEATLA